MRLLVCTLFLSPPAFAQAPPHKIAKLTDDAPKPQEVRVELRVVRVGASVRAKVADLLADGTSTEPGSAVVDDLLLYHILEAAMGDKSTSIMQAPRITADAGKPACVKVMDEVKFTTGTTLRATAGGVKAEPITEAVQVGQRFDVTATPRKNGEAVRVEVKYLCRSLGESAKPTAVVMSTLDGWAKGVEFTPVPPVRETKCEKAMTLPDGKSAVVRVSGGTRVKEEFGPPVLSQIPYLNRLFRNVGIADDGCDVYLIVTPKVLTPEPAELVRVGCVVPPPMPKRSALYATWVAATSRGNPNWLPTEVSVIGY